MQIVFNTLFLRIWPADQEIGITLLGVLEIPSLRSHPRKAEELETAF